MERFTCTCPCAHGKASDSVRVRALVRNCVTSSSVGRQGMPLFRLHPSRVTAIVFVRVGCRSNDKMVSPSVRTNRVLVPVCGCASSRPTTSIATFWGLTSVAVVLETRSAEYSTSSYTPQNGASCPPIEARQCTSSPFGCMGQPSCAQRSNNVAHGV